MEPVLSGAAPPGAKDGGGLRQSPMGEERSRPALENHQEREPTMPDINIRIIILFLTNQSLTDRNRRLS
jgi:hypothetical protein